MKATGFVRKIDDLGRMVIPKELREAMGIDFKDPIEIFVDDDNIIVLKKYAPTCIICGSSENIIEHGGKEVCKECWDDMLKIVK